MPELKTSNYATLSFDCYGTLIDWENGILGYLQPLLASHDVHVIDEWVLEFFGQAEPEIQARGGSYREVLRDVLRRLGTRCAFLPNDESLDDFADSIAYWQPFPDTVAAMRQLGKHFELAALSNIDDELFDMSSMAMQDPFTHIITAEQVGAYKPDKKMFTALKRQVKGPILHVAQSRFHDIVPATKMGLDTVWINRPSLGASLSVDANPTWTFDSLETFAAAWE